MPRHRPGGLLRKLLVTLLLGAIFNPCSALSSAVIVVTDDAGQKIQLNQPAERIVSIAPFLTELLFDVGAGKSIVGTVEFSDYPQKANDIPRIGASHRLDLEALLALKPDLIVAWGSGNSRELISQLRGMKFTVYVSEPRALEDIPRTLERLGQLAGTESAAMAAGANFRSIHSNLKQKYSGSSTVRMFYQIWEQPLMTVNDNHVINDVIQLCGGKNVFGKLDQLTPVIDVEAVLKEDPVAIVAGGMGEASGEWLCAWRAWPQLTAVKQDNLFFIPPSLLQRHTPRILQGAEQLCAALDQVRKR
ncbi:MAG: cobalamin-binding protein [Gammaproteobacteria bacterium]|nr:cobalamin-binding protein [Gammaproteobacteria bacterium]